jgi:putative transposase
MSRQLVMDFLNMAIESKYIKPGLIHRSDRGGHYASNKFQSLLKDNEIQCSMSRKGDCSDNDMAKIFFSTH